MLKDVIVVVFSNKKWFLKENTHDGQNIRHRYTLKAYSSPRINEPTPKSIEKVDSKFENNIGT